MFYAIAYDITDDTRRQKAAKLLEGFGRRVEKSLLECDLSAEELRRIRGKMVELLAASGDRCHIYRLCAGCLSHRIVLGSDSRNSGARY
jgi:CRISPR-associated protein Cas2